MGVIVVEGLLAHCLEIEHITLDQDLPLENGHEKNDTDKQEYG